MKVSKESVLRSLKDKNWHTCSEIAEELDTSQVTVGKRVKGLVTDGFAILAGRNGYRLREPEDINDEESAREIEQMLQRMINIVLRQSLVAKPIKTLAIEARKLLPKDPEERAIVRKYLVQLTHLIDFRDLDDSD